jgi:small subunit ribosomal protein S17
MKILQGTIVSDKMAKTVVVRVDRLRQHPKYLKFYRVSKRYKADVADAGGYQLGDVVRIQETRPISKDKRWKVISLVRRTSAEKVEAAAEEPSTPNEAEANQ